MPKSRCLVAALNVEKAQALYRIQRSELYPGVGVMAEGQNYRLPEKMPDEGMASIKEQCRVNVGVLSWELDFFGRLRSLKHRALNQYLAREQARAAAQTVLVAQRSLYGGPSRASWRPAWPSGPTRTRSTRRWADGCERAALGPTPREGPGRPERTLSRGHSPGPNLPPTWNHRPSSSLRESGS